MRTIFTIAAVLLLAAPAAACDGFSFAQSACYAAPAVALESYAAPAAVCAPYAYSAPQVYQAPAQAVILPPQVQIVRPEIRLQLAQVQSSYAAPLVVKQFAVKSYAQQAFVQKQYAFSAPQKVIVQRAPRLRLFGGRSVQRSFSRTIIRD